jgi:hypothetical protein
MGQHSLEMRRYERKHQDKFFNSFPFAYPNQLRNHATRRRNTPSRAVSRSNECIFNRVGKNKGCRSGCSCCRPEGLKHMRWIIISLMLSGALGAESPALAQTNTSYPFCIRGEEFSGWSGCTFETFEQCQGAATGTPAQCVSNPYYAPPSSAAASLPAESSNPPPVPVAKSRKR